MGMEAREAAMNFFNQVDFRAGAVVVLMLLVCAVPFAGLFADLRRSYFKKKG